LSTAAAPRSVCADPRWPRKGAVADLRASVPDTRAVRLVSVRGVGQSQDVERNRMARPNRSQWALGGASAACYALGYPIALIADNPLGWVLVTMGGVLLAILLAVTVRRIDRSR
jgi:hypothetical protein